MAYDKNGQWVPDAPASDRMYAQSGASPAGYSGNYVAGPGGNLGIWTGGAYDYSMPMSITRDMINPSSTSYYDADGQYVTNNTGYGLNYGGKLWSPDDSNYAFTNYDPNNPNSGFALRMKSGDKTGTSLNYKWDPATNSYVPDIQGGLSQNYWDTNTQHQDITGIASVALGGLGAGLGAEALGLAGAAGAGEGLGLAGAAGTGMAAGEGAMLGGGIAPLTYGGAGGMVGGVGTAGTAAGAGAAGLTELGSGSVAPLSSAPTIAEPATGGFLSQVSQYMKQGMSAMEAIQKASQALGGGGAGGSVGSSSQRQGGLLDLIAGLYSANQNKDMSKNYKDLYDQALQRQMPFLQQLTASYSDPNSFYNSNQWKGLESVYQNSIDRQAARGGTLANPTDREVKLQNYAMKSLEDYRRGLATSAGLSDPARYLGPMEKGIEAEAWANSPVWAALGLGKGGQGTNVSNIIKDLGDAGKSAEDIWKLVSGWFA